MNNGGDRHYLRLWSENYGIEQRKFYQPIPPLSLLNKFDVKEMGQIRNIHLYVHIPFCVRRCDFCYYKSTTVGRRGVPEEYLAALKKEIRAWSSSPGMNIRNVRSLYIGGGTPTLLSEDQLSSLVTTIMESFTFTPDFEFCCEARPGWETTPAKFKLLISLGLHRINFGCQSLDDDVLKASGCNHRVDEFYRVIDDARKTGIRTINVDLMTGLINQGVESFMQTIDGIISLRPENITIYKMEVYLNNRLFRKLREKSVKLISDTQEIEQVREGYRRLIAAGFILADHYSFYTSPEHTHIHRNGQWAHVEEMLGLGASSHSFMDSFMFQNESDTGRYIDKINRGEQVITRAYSVSKRELMVKRAVFGLKNLSHHRCRFVEEFGMDILDIFPEQFDRLEREGFITIDDEMITSTFEGALFADDIARAVFLPGHKVLKLAHMLR